MSHSDEQRLLNMQKALLIMLKELGNEPVWSKEFERDNEIFKDIFPTTWRELEERYLVKSQHTIGSYRYGLTGHGWYTAIQAVWDDNKEMLDEWLGTLMAKLKDTVKGRNENAYVYFDSFANETGLPIGFVYDAIESNLIEYQLSKKGAHWYEGRSGQEIEVPLDFGLSIL
jgi:hypothetical protein